MIVRLTITGRAVYMTVGETWIVRISSKAAIARYFDWPSVEGRGFEL